jgi:hypothetical protein
MIVMRMREQQVGDVGRPHAAFGEALDQHDAHAHVAGIDQREAAVRAHEHDRAPAKPRHGRPICRENPAPRCRSRSRRFS